jgi:hypothetical protein
LAKPYGRLLKNLADEDPRGLLFLFGILPISAVDVEIASLPREVLAPSLEVDHLYRLRTGDAERLIHLEFQTHYKLDLPDRLMRYSMLLHLKYQLPVECVLVLLAERNAPAAVPSSYRVKLGGIEVWLNYRVVRLWEIDGGPALGVDKARILPLVPLLKVSPEQLWQAAEGIAKSQDERRRLEFLSLGGLRYDREQLRKLLEAAMLNILTPEMMRESSFYEIMREAVEPMIEADIARRALRRVLKVRFPGLETASELDNIKDLGRLESLIEVAAGENDRSKMESALHGV